MKLCFRFNQFSSVQRWLLLIAIAPASFLVALLSSSSPATIGTRPTVAIAQTVQPTQPAQPLTLRSDVQEANSKTGVITARGNVQIYYPARQIQATSAQAQYFSRERRIVLTGDVYVLQQGNSLRGETITYLIDEGRFVALPQPAKQVEAIYLLRETTSASPTPAAPAPIPTPVVEPFGQPQFSAPNGGANSAPGNP